MKNIKEELVLSIKGKVAELNQLIEKTNKLNIRVTTTQGFSLSGKESYPVSVIITETTTF